MNPMQFLQMIREGQNPQQLVINLLQTQANNPIAANLLNMAQHNDGAGIEQVARNVCQQQGVNFDEAFNSFKQQLGIK